MLLVSVALEVKNLKGAYLEYRDIAGAKMRKATSEVEDLERRLSGYDTPDDVSNSATVSPSETKIRNDSGLKKNRMGFSEKPSVISEQEAKSRSERMAEFPTTTIPGRGKFVII